MGWAFKEFLPTKFKKHVRFASTNECWEWQGPKANGYGKCGNQLAHRMSYELFKGRIPGGLCVCHRCDNPPCVNPEHLWLGTVRDNNFDRHHKGRTAHGEHLGEAIRQARWSAESRERAAVMAKERRAMDYVLGVLRETRAFPGVLLTRERPRYDDETKELRVTTAHGEWSVPLDLVQSTHPSRLLAALSTELRLFVERSSRL